MAEDRAVAEEATNYKALFVSTIVVIIGISVGISSPLFSQKWIGDIVSDLGSAIVSIGIISIIYDLIMRRQLQRELIRLVGIERALAKSQILSGGSSTDVSWTSILRSKVEYKCLLLDPHVWISNYWHIIESSASNHSILLSVIVPFPIGSYFPTSASFMGYNRSSYEQAILQAVSDLEGRWRSAAGRGRLSKGSRIEIRYADNLPAYSIVMADSDAVILIPTPYGRTSGYPEFFVHLGGSRQTYPGTWLADALDEKKAAGIAYINEVK